MGAYSVWGIVTFQGVAVAKADEFTYVGQLNKVTENGRLEWMEWMEKGGRRESEICDRRVSARMKGKVCKLTVTLVTPAMLYGTEIVARTI